MTFILSVSRVIAGNSHSSRTGEMVKVLQCQQVSRQGNSLNIVEAGRCQTASGTGKQKQRGAEAKLVVRDRRLWRLPGFQ